MKKPFLLTLALLLLISLISVNIAAAVPFTAYTVESNGSTVQEQDFTLNDTPWLYMEGIFVPPDPEQNSVGALISWDTDNNVAFSVRAKHTGSKVWLSLANGKDSNQNPVSWDSIKELGEWHVNAYYFSVPYGGNFLTTFNVVENSPVPEPMTLTLLLAGGMGVMVTRRLWNRD